MELRQCFGSWNVGVRKKKETLFHLDVECRIITCPPTFLRHTDSGSGKSFTEGTLRCHHVSFSVDVCRCFRTVPCLRGINNWAVTTGLRAGKFHKCHLANKDMRPTWRSSSSASRGGTMHSHFTGPTVTTDLAKTVARQSVASPGDTAPCTFPSCALNFLVKPSEDCTGLC